MSAFSEILTRQAVRENAGTELLKQLLDAQDKRAEQQYAAFKEMIETNQHLIEISKRLPVGADLLKRWKTEEEWEKKRAEYIKNSRTFRCEFITFGRLLIQRVNAKLAEGENVSASELFTAAKLASEILKDEVKKEDKKGRSQSSGAGLWKAKQAAGMQRIKQVDERNNFLTNSTTGGFVKPVLFLPYQTAWLDDKSRYKVWEKSRRIGATWTQAYEDVRDCLSGMVPAVWFSSADLSAAREYILYCAHWAGLFNAAFETTGEAEGKSDIKSFTISFTNGSRINALSSNPSAFRSKGGKLVLDEFAFHKDDNGLWRAAKPIVTWGYPVRIISTHNGKQALYYKFIEGIRKKKLDWSLHTVTIFDAVAQGLTDKIFNRPTTHEERASWIEAEKQSCAGGAVWEQEYCCDPVDESTAFIPHHIIDNCCGNLVLNDYSAITSPLYVGVDIARRRDMSVIWGVCDKGGTLETCVYHELKGMRFKEQETLLFDILAHPMLRRVCIDETGIGMQMAENALDKFGRGLVEPVYLTAKTKEAIAYEIRTALEEGRLIIPGFDSVRSDFHGVQRVSTSAGNIRLDAKRTGDGHADRFWAAALAVHAYKTPELRVPVVYSRKKTGTGGKMKNLNDLTKETVTALARGETLTVAGILPNPDEVLRKRGEAKSTYVKVMRDPRVVATSGSRKAGVKKLLWQLNRGVKDSGGPVLDFTGEWLGALDMNYIISRILDACQFGMQPMEVIWGRDGRHIIPLELKDKPFDWFGFNSKRQLRFKAKGNREGVAVPDKKILLARHDHSYDNPYGVSLLSLCFWSVAMKRGALPIYLNYLERFGSARYLATLKKGATGKEHADALDSLERLISDAAATIEEGAKVELMESHNKSSTDSIFTNFLNYCDQDITLVQLGQTLTTAGGGSGSYALGKVHGEVRSDIVDSDARIVEETINRLIRWTHELNYPKNTGIPLFSMYREEDVDLELAKRDAALAATGQIRFSKSYFIKNYGFNSNDIFTDEVCGDRIRADETGPDDVDLTGGKSDLNSTFPGSGISDTDEVRWSMAGDIELKINLNTDNFLKGVQRVKAGFKSLKDELDGYVSKQAESAGKTGMQQASINYLQPQAGFDISNGKATEAADKWNSVAQATHEAGKAADLYKKDLGGAMDTLHGELSRLSGPVARALHKGSTEGLWKALGDSLRLFAAQKASHLLMEAAYETVMGAAAALNPFRAGESSFHFAAASQYAAGAALMGSFVMGANLAGQAHGGIDYIPREGTWLLDRGERVVDSRTNRDLKEFIASGRTGVSVNITINGGDKDSLMSALPQLEQTIIGTVAGNIMQGGTDKKSHKRLHVNRNIT
ncbi:hypothetical protein AAG570_014029 [Ranatra chinensis]|uniref:Terminase large subunit gp17-like C-terminal domain-containing protein n=1 Tax=Ranatra chinensis TaxID=642074 RepID=A0ABD0Y5P2_9HEMI